MGRVVTVNPIQIQLLSEPKKHKDCCGNRLRPNNIVFSAITLDAEVVYLAHIATRKRDRQINANRRSFRHEREKRIRAIKYDITKDFPSVRILPACSKPIFLKYIINNEVIFNNRKRLKCWITPSTHQLVKTHNNIVQNLIKLIAIDYIVFEWNKFAFMQLDGQECYL